MNVEKRLKELGLHSYGSQAINLTVEYGWVSVVKGGNPGGQYTDREYRATVKLFMWVENGRSIIAEGHSIEKVLDKAEEQLKRYKEDKELDELRRKMHEIHTMSACHA